VVRRVDGGLHLGFPDATIQHTRQALFVNSTFM